MNRLVLIFFFILTAGCTKNSLENVSHLNGYWEIYQVKNNNKLVKEFTVNTTVDYFEINDSLSGFRKKVSPTLDGKFLVNEDLIEFTLKAENDSLNIYYLQNGILTKETILKVNENELIIANSQGFKYFYKPFTSLNLENE